MRHPFLLRSLLLLATLPALSPAAMLSSSQITISDATQSQRQWNTYQQDWLLTVTGGSGSGFLDLSAELDTVTNEGNLRVNVDTWASLLLESDAWPIGDLVQGPGVYGNPQINTTLTIPFTFGTPEIIHVKAYTLAAFTPSMYAADARDNQYWQGQTIYGKVLLDTTPRYVRTTYEPNYFAAAFATAGPQVSFTPVVAAPEPSSLVLLALGLILLAAQRRLAFRHAAVAASRSSSAQRGASLGSSV